ncbi:MAG TPA: flavodoxin-dependent (E)-4-hydroxy-3-methylbut-2-enyl-diphosphate synthase [Stellaceae bacterium]|nr:flavodoxin-dependent (E)-4-hydroxy-3-methylbut-2-enyl-diphosphate synthase [Stellaceae bacterium]
MSRRRSPRAVLGCVVNGPGEARETDIGFTGGGNGTHQVYITASPTTATTTPTSSTASSS